MRTRFFGKRLGCWSLFAGGLLVSSVHCSQSPAVPVKPPVQSGSVEHTAAVNDPVSDPFGVRSDSRMGAPRDLNGYFPFAVPSSLEAWEKQKQILKMRMRFALGLDTAPKAQVLRPVIHGTRQMEGYRISKVFFESMPGFYVTGSLYRPLPGDQQTARPGILCPHGHWTNGRFMYANDDEVNEALQIGGEALECAARSPLQARCVHLARMGCVVFHYDMIGYADSQQIRQEVAHGFSQQRMKLSAPGHQGLFSPAAEQNNLSVMTLQTLNSQACLDFLASLPEVDPDRLAITGASGGGTQSFILSALDDRLALSFPAVMVGTAMQGGCTCENCSNLRTLQGNVDFAAMFAPKPLGMTAADDWTIELDTKGYPELQKVYQLYGKPENVHLTSRTEFKHNYNQVGRQAMYQWVGKHFGLEVPPETKFTLLRSHELSVFLPTERTDNPEWDYVNELDGQGGTFPKMEKSEAFEQQLYQAWMTQRDQQERDHQQDAQAWIAVYLSDAVPGQSAAEGTDATAESDENQLHWSRVETDTDSILPNDGSIAIQRWALTDRRSQTVLPVRILGSSESLADMDQPSWADHSLLLCLGTSPEDLLGPDGQWAPWVQQAVNDKQWVVQVDLWGQGEFLKAGYDPLDIWQPTRREFGGYVYGYNYPAAIQRARDVLSLLDALQAEGSAPELKIVASGQGAAALTLAAPAIGQHWKEPLIITLNADGFRFSQVDSLLDPNFVPGSTCYGDVPWYWARAMESSAQIQLQVSDRTFADWRDAFLNASYQAGQPVFRSSLDSGETWRTLKP